jgi:hypothetical protein
MPRTTSIAAAVAVAVALVLVPGAMAQAPGTLPTATLTLRNSSLDSVTLELHLAADARCGSPDTRVVRLPLRPGRRFRVATPHTLCWRFVPAGAPPTASPNDWCRFDPKAGSRTDSLP